MQLKVFTELAISGGVSGVIISTDRSDERKRKVVDVVTVFNQTVRLSTANKMPRYFRNTAHALEILSSQTGELKKVKVKIIDEDEVQG
ncbi:TPA: hypothetical protein JHJ64_004571 [Enterobacter cloacae]|uniref:hypothetical protein n=1 Tax=Enterobacter hormaechei TaxID=158836 RepID=UPI00190C781F|nr:hypothetical protein [Enterobacter hormaechei]HAV2128660.1 hypothetical protein [Enterobacter cloacae]HBR4538453.1 hypothetical protein [Klebsiella pneumoniae]MBK4366973.1 hypothetical protein [Enterobacter hormaechei]MBK4597721.1 hypothetical protein [Enterobacter hormaechei]WLZ47515.1 hypothetical protein QPR64_23610 [Enterobacter hormaechei]